MTWHEDREVNPGVPDLSFVMNDYDCETGWLELKADDHPGDGKVKARIEPSQHQWISRHAKKIPVYILWQIGPCWYLIHGTLHDRIAASLTISEIEDHSVVYGDFRNADIWLKPVLYRITHRDRLKNGT